MRSVFALVAGLVVAGAAHAEQFVGHGEFRVHYAAIATTDVAPETARVFGVSRSRRHALLVLNAQRVEGGATTPVAAIASGTARSLIGHVQKLELRPVQEGRVHYVIAEVEVLDQEWLTFELEVVPDGAVLPVAIKFQQQFFQDP